MASKRKRNRMIKRIRLVCLAMLVVLLLVVLIFVLVDMMRGETAVEVPVQPEIEDVAMVDDPIEDTITIEIDTEDAISVEEPEMEEPEEVVPEIADVTMVFTGDICFHDDFSNMSNLRARGGKIESSIDGKLLDEMKAADICMVNNEFPYSDRGAPLPGKTYAFRSKPSNVSYLADMGVDIVSLANNHVYDHGEVALLDTLDILKNAGVPYVGAGHDLAEASAPYYFEINGRKIAYIAATQVERNGNPDTKGATESSPGAFRCYTEQEFANLISAIEKAEAEADMTVVYIHWGTENTDVLHWAQTDQAPKIVAAGADLVIGDHPHCLQNVDYINGVPVFYSLGNYWFNSKNLDSGMVKVVYRADGQLDCQFIAAKQHDCRTDMESGAEKQRILDYMQCISPNVTFDADGNITNRPYDGPPINYAAVERVPDPPATATPTVEPSTDPAAGQNAN